VLVRVTAAGIGFADVQIRAGLMRQAGLPELPMPFSPGFEVAGTVADVGPGVDPAMIGRQAVGVARAAALHAGDSVLVEAAAGGVGSLLVQLARRAGATVIAVARGERKLAVAEGLGAHTVIDYSAPDWHEQARDAAGGSVRVVLETTGGAVSAAAFDLLTPGTGRMVIYGTTSGQPPRFDPLAVYHRGVSVTGFASTALAADARARLRDEAFALAANGELKPIIGAVLPLSEAAAAHQAFEERTTIGKTVLTP
jgi:NADPH:quinone reductase